jgi:hypothetical protein
MHLILSGYRVWTARADPGFKVSGGVHLKKLRRAEGGANFFSNFRPPPGSAPGLCLCKIVVELF